MQTVYVDVLLVLNWVIDYLLLRLTAHFLRLSVSRKRLVLGAGVGAFGALVILLPPLPWGLDVLVKLLLSAAVIAAAFGVKSPRAFLRAGLSFFFLSFAFAGVLVAVWAVFAPQGLFVKNSVVYFDVPPLLLILLALGVYVFLRIVQRLCGRGAVKDTACTLKLTLGGAHASLSARVDTGCTLKEPFSGLPVIVVAGTALPRPGTPPRIIPYASVGGEGLLPAWRPESVCLQFPDKEIHPSLCYVAFSERPLSGAVQALLPPDLLEDGDVHPIQKEDRRESQTVHPKIPQNLWKKLACRLFSHRVDYINGPGTLPPPLTREEEAQVFQNIEREVPGAREPLITHNLRLVVYIARKFESSGAGIEDLISIGTIGLIKAVNTFCPQRKIKLATYASRCIENEILMLL